MSLLHTRTYSSWARGHLLCRVENAPGRFALTFDDGPSGRHTPDLLDRLRRHDARATFFLLSRRIEQHPSIVRRLVAEGHEPALHGDRHWPLPLMPPWSIRREIDRCAAALDAAAGVRARFYRPPFGFMAPGQSRFVRGLGYESVLGDVYPEDPQRPGVDRIVSRTLPRLVAGSILILHDGSPVGDPDRFQTLEAVDIILQHSARLGLRAVTVRDLVEAGGIASRI